MKWGELKTLEELKESALQELDGNARFYFSAAGGGRESLQYNQIALSRYKIRPRVLRDVSKVDLSATLLGSKLSFPVGIAPMGLLRLAHPKGEGATAKAAAAANTVMTVSCAGSTTIEDVAIASPEGLKWMQLYLYKDRAVTRDLVLRAEKSGYQAFVVTIDSPVAGLWRTGLPPNFISIVSSMLPNFKGLPHKLLDPSLTFKDLLWLKSITSLPIIAKGIMTGEDAVEAAKHGVAAIWVSNHSSRQIDGVDATIEVLREVVEAVKDYDVEVYMDGGIRTGSDVFRALAFGARFVFIGRPVIWSLAIAGEDGVIKVLKILKEQLERTMALAGVSCLGNITPNMIKREGCQCKL